MVNKKRLQQKNDYLKLGARLWSGREEIKKNKIFCHQRFNFF